MPAIINAKGEINQVELNASLYKEAHDANLSVAAFLNRKYGAQADTKQGSAFHQMCASMGVFLPKQNDAELRAASIGDILTGKAALNFDAANTQQRNGDYGGLQSRILFPAAVVDMIESALQKDLQTDLNLFGKMIALNLGVASDLFEQPIVNYSAPNGPDGADRARAQRIGQLAEPAAMATFTTSHVARRLPTYSIGAEFSDQALRATTLDLVSLTLTRFFAVERDGRVYNYLSNLFAGDADFGTGAISAVTSTSLDSAATGGVLTHKAWVKFLYRKRKYRRIDYVICDLDTYMKIEGRTGRPGSIGVLDPTLPKIDPQASVMNPYVENVKVMLVDAAADGGPVPANTVWALDSRWAIIKVTNTTAAYEGAERFAMKRSEAFRIDWSEAVYRQFDDAFDILTIS